MAWIWIALSIGLLALLCFALLDTAKREDRDARRAEKSEDPLGDADITLTGSGRYR